MLNPIVSMFGVLCLSIAIVQLEASCCNSCDNDNNLCLKDVKRSIRQCTYTNLAEGKDVGQIMTCDFRKSHSDTALRITYQGDLRVVSDTHAFRRWFITINGKECTSPATIEAAIHPGGVKGLNNHRPGTLGGFCENVPKGRVIVGLSVGNCKYGYEKYSGDAYTCWGSVCRLIIEEVAPLQ